jgi:hypothetical protein
VAYQKPDNVDVFVVSGLETSSDGETYKVTLSKLSGNIIPANTGVLLFSEQVPETATDRYWTTEAVGAANAHASYTGINLLEPIVEPSFIPGTVTSDGEVVERNFMFGFYCIDLYSETPPAIGQYNYLLGFWRSSLAEDANPQNNLSSAHMAYLPLNPEQYGTSTYGEFDAPGNPTQSPFIHFAFDDENDGIGEVRPTAPVNGLYYSLEGVSMSRPTKKGIYIHNGVKIVVK